MTSDLLIISTWWVYLFFLGLISLPLAYFLFHKFLDFAYPFCKVLSFAFVSYLVWILGSLHLLEFSRTSIFISIFIYFCFNLFLFIKFKKDFLQSLRRNLKLIIFEEIIFYLALVFWSFIRGYRPEVEGLEKFMDFGFVNSILRSKYFPPEDMWMSGKTINYYYFGHLVSAVLTKLTEIKSFIAYNLSIATIFALTLTGTFSLGGNIFYQYLDSRDLSGKKTLLKYFLLAGFITAFLITLAGNMQPLYYFITNHFNFKDYWFPDATRFIVEKFGAKDNTIHEFPIYSFVVADLHGHLSDLPFVLLFLSLVVSYFVSEEKRNFFSLKFTPIFCFLLAIMYMTNSWDFPIYLMILGITSFFLFFKSNWELQKLYRLAGFGGIIVAGAIFLSLPFHLNFKQIAEGLNFVTYRSPVLHLFVLWGFPWFLGLLFIIFLIIKKQFKKTLFESIELLTLIFIFVGTFLVIIPEIIYVKDIYISSYQRANTVFKLVYQSFILYGFASGFILTKLIFTKKEWFSKIAIIFCLVPISFLIFYPLNSIHSFYGQLKKYQGLNEGLSFLKTTPDDFSAILWLEENVKGQPVVLEAVGDSYTTFDRVSAVTGFPTVEGWLVHEWLWRGGFDEPQKRSGDVEKIYISTDQNETKKLIDQYKIKYIFVGSKEKEKYKVSEEKFRQIGSIAFSSGGTRIYQFD